VAAWIVAAITAVCVITTSISWVGILRDVFRFRCDYLSDGEYADWVCADGIGYILPGLVLLGLEGLVGIAAIMLLTLSQRRPGAWRALAALGAGPVAIVMTAWLLADPPADAIVPETFWFAVASLGVLAAASAAASCLGPHVGAPVCLGIAAAAGLVALLLQPGLVSPCLLGVGLSIVTALAWKPHSRAERGSG